MSKLIKLMAYRIKHDKIFLIIYLVLIPIVIGIAVYVTNSISFRMQFAIVGDIETKTHELIEYTYLDEVPDTSKLVLNEYDAILVEEFDKIKIISTKGEEYNEAIQLFVTGQIEELLVEDSIRGSASNILGFLMMIISLLGVQIYQYYFDERKGINKRIIGTSISCKQYMLSHFIVALSFMFIPACIILCAALYLFDIALSIYLWQFILILFLLCFFSTSFGLWINSYSKSVEESMMLGNMFAIVGSVVSGGFVQVTNNEIFNSIVQIFPQKQIMSSLSSLENATTFPYLGIIYVVVLSIILIYIAIHIEKKKLPFR